MSEIVAEEVELSGPTTLSGRPTVSEQQPTAPRQTKVSRTAVVVVTAFLVAVLVFAGLAFLRSGPKGTDVRAMQPGDCYTEVATTIDSGRAIPRGETTPCSEGAPRIVAVVALPLGPFPEADGLNQAIAQHCGAEQDQIIAPTAETWAAGDRTVVCIALPDVG